MTVTVTYANTVVKPEFVTNTYVNANQLTPDVLGLSGGGFVSAYHVDTGGANFDLLNFYDAGFNVIGTYEVPYADPHTIAVGQPVMTELANGNVLVVWDDETSLDPQGPGLKGAIFDANGDQVATGLKIAGSAVFYGEPSVTALAGGGFVVSMSFTSSPQGIYISTFDADGNKLSDPDAVALGVGATQSDSQVTALTGGDFVVTWTDASGANDQILGRHYDATGAALGSAFLIGTTGDNNQSSIAAMQNGDFAVVYADSGWGEAGTLGNGITLQIFQGDGVNVTPGTFIHVNTVGIPDEVSPDVAVMANGFILVTWTHPFSGTDNDIYARIFDASGQPVTVNGNSGEFVVTGGSSNDTASAVAALLGGDFIVSWQDSGAEDGSGNHIASAIMELTRTVVGDASNDSFTGDALRDNMDGGSGNDTLSGGGGDDTILGGGHFDQIDGGDGDDLLQGGFDNDTIHGGDGADRIYAGQQSDPFTSTAGDVIFAEAGNDYVVGASGDDSIDGGDGADTLYGRDGLDTVFGGVGDDKIKGGKDADLLQGGADHDTVIGGGGDDTIYGNSESSPDGSSAGDTLTGNGGDDLIFGSVGVDQLSGGGGADTLYGGAGSDFITAGAGKDILVGGDGADTLLGGADKDVFLYFAASDTPAVAGDLISDLTNKDRIDLHLIDANSGKAGNQGFTLVSSFTGHAGELTVAYHASGPLAGLTTIEGDVDGDGVADLTIYAAGDHHTFLGFTL